MKTISVVVLLSMAAVCHAQYRHMDLGFHPGARSSSGAFTLHQSVGAPFGGISSSSMFVVRHGFLSSVQIPGTTEIQAPPNTAQPTAYTLLQNYPNPFNPSTTLPYTLPERSYVVLTVFNTLGEQLAILQNGVCDAGYHEVLFNAVSMPAGVYFYRMHAGPYVETKKLILLK